jgi:hypothetical protein
MKLTKQERNQKSSKPPARPYSAPRLIVYGTIQALTQAGNGSLQENNPGQGPTSKFP